ncbi:deacylase [uncultured Fretibacterium sp.]|uniref:deacylase n=1 Tax=uncultured Fretibacterium sp. TaxID=1678694 RepID=UPI0026322FC3|nr:deacylase [uncultured Fretibacterium sp.]
MMSYESGAKLRQLILLCCALGLAWLGGREFVELREMKESVVVSDSFTRTFMLSDYFPPIKGTEMDTPVYLFDSGVPGGSMLYLGGTHPYEPATSLSAYLIMENLNVEKGRVFVCPHANRSASTVGMLGNAYPKFLHVETPFGPKPYRIGDRNSSPLDQWPDPFTYVHYPSGQNLDYTDSRNLNRTFPGRPDGNLTEQLAFAIMELTRKENITLFVDSHEASLMYPVVATYVAHDRAQDMAMMAAMELTDTEFPMKCEASPKSLRGLTHREVGDFSDALVILMETPEPFIDRVAGKITEDLMMTGKDEFLQTAAEHELLFCPYDISVGCPMWDRVGRHLSGTLAMIRQMNDFATDPEKELRLSFPTYTDVKEKGLGAFYHDPSKADPSKVFWN